MFLAVLFLRRNVSILFFLGSVGNLLLFYGKSERNLHCMKEMHLVDLIFLLGSVQDWLETIDAFGSLTSPWFASV
jgi:hypothetical protein